MKVVYLIRSAPYDYNVTGMNLYKSFNVVGKGEYEVEISEKEAANFAKKLSDELKCETVFTSQRRRSIQTAQLLTPQPIVVEELREVGYTMEEFISEADFFDADGKPNVTRARKAFVRALITNELKESFNEVIERVEFLIGRLQKTDAEKIVMVSHGFFMKIFEAYVRDPKIKVEPKRLLKYFSGETETFGFGEGVRLELKKGEGTLKLKD